MVNGVVLGLRNSKIGFYEGVKLEIFERNGSGNCVNA